jgi:predicted N-acetyltransferase YhbS
MAVCIELLESRHHRARFDCGDPRLNDFIIRLAGQQQRRGLSKTYVALANGGPELLGFVTLSVGQVAAQVMPPHLKLPRYPIPVLRIARLAVALQEQGKGIGQDLLAFSLRLALAFSAKVGLFAVVVDAKHDTAAAFYRRLGFQATLDDPLCLFMPLSQLAQATEVERK